MITIPEHVAKRIGEDQQMLAFLLGEIHKTLHTNPYASEKNIDQAIDVLKSMRKQFSSFEVTSIR